MVTALSCGSLCRKSCCPERRLSDFCGRLDWRVFEDCSSLHDELALFVESGLTPLAALQSGTLRPAEFLGRTEELGVIAPGRRADLVLLSADPLADIHNTTKIQAVWLHGKYFDRTALDAILEAAKHGSGKGKLH